jgi:phosphoserine aminotransferase
MEHSHRGKDYEAVHNEAIALLRELLGLGDDHHVLFLQGGASQQFAVLPMNLLHPGRSADYVLTGVWSEKARDEAQLLGKVRIAGDTGRDGKYMRVPEEAALSFDAQAVYAHVTSNNTIFGTQWPSLPSSGNVPLVVDMSSDFLSRPLGMDPRRVGVIYAGAQKNIGPSGVTVVIARKDLVDGARKDIPKIFRYATHAKENSLYNTPPTFGIYLARNVLAWIKELGGLTAMAERNQKKAAVLYAAIDAGFYRAPVEKRSRSQMNVVWTLPSEELEKEFLAEAAKRRMVGLKGHRSVGGCRASIYNACEPAWVQTLAEFMREFAQRKG